MNLIDSLIFAVAPRVALERARARLAIRTYEAAAPGRRTSGWSRSRADVNTLIAVAGPELRIHARNLVENNGYAKRARRVIANNVVGWGIVPRPNGESAEDNAAASKLWKQWADSTDCDADGRLTFAGLQHLAIRSIFTDGEVLIRRRFRRPEDGLAIPLQIQILEADFLDSSKNLPKGTQGGPVIQGVEFDAIGRRTGYWLFDAHPGNNLLQPGVSHFVPASEICHVYDVERPGAARGVSWLGSAIVNLNELDEFEDAELMKQKIAACFSAFVTDPDGTASPLGNVEGTDENGDEVEVFEPGMIMNLPPGKNVVTASPPQVTNDGFTVRNLRKIAVGLGITYEDLTGDYSQVNYSSARMGRVAHQADVRHWQNDMIVPQLCGGVWSWVMQAAVIAGLLSKAPGADWTVPPMALIEPDKEGLAYQRLVRVGAMTPSQMVREQGGDPDAHWAEYAKDMETLDALKIKLDSDVRAVSQAGLTQERVGAAPKPGAGAPGENAPPNS